MATDRVRVIQKASPRGLIPLFALVGIGTAPVLVRVVDGLMSSPRTPALFSNPVAFATFLAIAAYTPLAIVTTVGGWRFQHAGRLAVAGAAYGIALVATLMFHAAATSPDGGVESADGWIATLLGITVGGVIGAGVATLTIRVFRSMAFRTVNQTGQLCWTCGYDLGGPAVTACPECACPRRDSPPSRGAIGPALLGVLKITRPLLALILVCSAAWGGWILTTRTIPAARFLHRFDTGDNEAYGYVGSWKPPVTGKVYRTGTCRWIPLSPRTPGTVLLLVFDPSVGEGETAMDLMAVPAPTARTPIMPGSPPIAVCELTRQQADRVIKDGVPPSLMEQLTADVLAQPAPAAGTINPIVHVSAGAHFQGSGAK